MRLYYSDLLMPRKACAVARYVRSDVTFVYLDVTKGDHKTPAFLAINPNGKVPALTDGETRLWESDAIMCHLSMRAGAELWPDDNRQIEVVRWLSWSANHFTRAGGELYFERVIKPRFSLGAPNAAAIDDALVKFRQLATILDAHLDGRRWLLDDALTVADFSVGNSLAYAGQAQMPLGCFPNVVRWYEQLAELPGWLDPFPASAKREAD